MLGARLLAACDELATRLAAAGVPATLDRDTVQLPGAWLVPATLDLTTLGGDGTARVDVVLVAGLHDNRAVLTALAGLLDQCLAALVVPAEPVDTSWAVALREQTFPAWRLPVDLDI
jgi:hypothetical protein